MKVEEITKFEKSPQTIALLKKIKMENRKKLLKKHKVKYISLGIFLSVVVVAMIFIDLFVVTIYKVDLDNMSSTLQIDDKVFINKNFDKIETGGIYQFEKDGKMLINRCVGVGGDHIIIENDQVFINAVLFEENYVSSEMESKINVNILIPQGKLFFLGDNRNNSWDSRYWTYRFVDESDIIGEVTKIVYPFGRAKDITAH